MNENNKEDLRDIYAPGDQVFYNSISLKTHATIYSKGTVERVTKKVVHIKPDYPENERFLSKKTGLIRYTYYRALQDVIKRTKRNAIIVEQLAEINHTIEFAKAKEQRLLDILRGGSSNV